MKIAICAGINDYPGTSNDLSGCVNDANDWKNLLTDFGFEVTVLLNSQVTKNNFKSAIQNAISKLNKGDVLVVTYSGHGTQVTDYDSDEADGYDEALYLYDGALIDDELRIILNQIKDGVHVFFVLDSCFSGTITRKIMSADSPLGKPRFIPNPLVPANLKLANKFLSQEDMKEIVLTGCSDSEYSYDAYINGKWNGAMTSFAIKSISQSQTYEEFYSKLRKYLPSSTYPQTPQLECKEKYKTIKMFEPFNTDGGDDSGNQNDISNNNGCLLAFLPKIFSSKKKVEKLTKEQLIVICNELGINYNGEKKEFIVNRICEIIYK